MNYKKFRADHLFDGYRLLGNQYVLVTTDDGTIEAIVPASEAGDDLQEFKGILSPGLVNCHCHLELSHLAGLVPAGTGLVEFVLQVMAKRQNPSMPAAWISSCIEKAENEMLANGIVAVGDICNDALTLHQKNKGRLQYHNFIEASGFNPAIVSQRFERAVQIHDEFAASLPATSIAPHAPYSVAEELWKLIIHFPGNRLLTIHNQETIGENEWFRNKQGELLELYEKMNIDTSFFHPSGKSSLQTYGSKFLPGQQVILVHNVFTNQEDLAWCQLPIVNCKLTWCLCPNANLYISGRLPDVDLLLKNDCRIVLGTDSLASNRQLSITEEMKSIRHHFPHIEIETVLKWATSNGAAALQLDALLGSFEKGKKPGIVLLNNDLGSVVRLSV